jgi:transposase
MDKIEYRAVMKFFVKEGLTPNEIHSKFVKVYGDYSPSFSTIQKWAAKFKCGRTSLEDDPREGCPKSATPEIIEQVHDTVLKDWRMKVHEIAETIGISKECVGYILHEELDIKKLCTRWVPRLLTADQKGTHMKISEQCLECFNKNKTHFVYRFITMDETWIHHYHQNSNSTQNSGQKPVVQRHRRQGWFHQQERSRHWCFGMLKAFCLLIILKSGKTITVEYYSNLLTRLDKKFVRKDPVCKRKNHLSSGKCTRPQKCFGNGKIKGSAL